MKQTLRQAREAKGLSVLELAVYSGTSVMSIYGWENGTRRPRPAKLKALCEVLDVDEADLIIRPVTRQAAVADFIREAESQKPQKEGDHDEQ